MSAVSVAAAGHAGDAAKLLKISHRRQDKLRATPAVAIRHRLTKWSMMLRVC